MRTRPFATAVLLLLATALPARPQDIWDLDWGDRPLGARSLSFEFAGGLNYSTDWNQNVVLANLDFGTRFEQVLLRQVQVDPAFLFAGSVTYRRGRGGARLQFGYSHSCLAVNGRCSRFGVIDTLFTPLHEVDVNTYSADIDGEISLVDPEKVRWARPFVLFGLGGVVYDPGDNAAQLLPFFIDARGAPIEVNGGNIVVVNFPTGALLVTFDGIGLKSVLAGVLGLGTDIQIPFSDGSGIGLRLQVADHIANSPFKVRVAGVQRGFGGPFFEPTKFDFGDIHNIRLTVGLHVDVGLGGATAASQRRVPGRRPER
ncbi:MAG TPA: hypothetical protein VFQ38_15710 [Longimicrobiales bacterium]|nr:hypothetical protein [Longimicrobiales bacterium]